jgi:secreted trypsin-like serine protease
VQASEMERRFVRRFDEAKFKSKLSSFEGNGDSGGGMVFKQGKQFYLRGVISISIALQNTLKCDPNHYAVFVDAAKYTTWIKQNI